MEDRNAKEEIKINKFELDVALEEQPDLYLDWALAHVEAVKQKDIAKVELEKIKSALGMEVRKNPTGYGLKEKFTVQAVEEVVISHKDYQEANRVLVETANEANRLAAVREAFDQRRSSLKYLTELWTNDYYGQSVGDSKSVSKDENKISDKSSEEQRKGIEGTMNRRSRR